MAVRKNPIINTATTLGKLLAFLAVSGLCGVLVAGLVVPAVALTGSATSASIDAFDQLPDELKTGDPAVATKILASDGSLIANLYTQNRQPVAFDKMSPFIKKAVVAIEDSRFYEHGGVDATGIMRALAATLQGGRQGASTITQQYVNNKIIQGLEAQDKGDQAKLGADKTVADKLREMKLAIALEKQQSKDQILAGYLNIVNFSNGAYGIQAAAQRYFGVDASKLTLVQSALLAGVVNSPSFYDPIANPDNAKNRRNEVLDKMLAQKMISKKDHDTAIATPIKLNPKIQPQGCATAVTAPFFCDYVAQLILNNADYGKTVDDRKRLLYQGGLTIKTTLDPKAQLAAQEQQDNTTLPTDNRGSAMVSVVPGTGKIVAMAQNNKMSTTEGPGKTALNYSIPQYDSAGNPLGGLGMQVGSTMKPFTFAAWLAAGKSMETIVDGSKRRYGLGTTWTNTCGTTTGYFDSTLEGSEDLQNDDATHYYPMSVLNGLINSINTVTFASASQLDFCKIKQIADEAGLKDVGNSLDANKKSVKKATPLTFSNASSLLGTDSIDPITMANAFATFAAKGVYCNPVAIEAITDTQGKSLSVPTADCKQSMDPEVAAGVLFGLKNVLSAKYGSGSLITPDRRPSDIGFDIGAKTGTTNGNVDTWVVGTTTGLATASWFGNPKGTGEDPAYYNQGPNGITINNKHYNSIDGSDIAGTAFSNFMYAVAPSYGHDNFPQPPSSMIATPYVAPPVTPAKPGATNGATTQPSAPATTGTGNNNGNGNGKKKS
ncbi:membrane peptidoglycan carboxypeptidase [Psychromicrobium silvestre]|uniref:Membrane peptidoglycan carboxypeptidase n=1 Tax=Psychromicrobium silvestre TaxID=1645614 RepID=A0A7Y9LU16_9MICC|nr:transglycosylase domain-containing protein [Psychromicrobium silvestre]NYE95604.1 membrane peptidoglycan carboxypeptidase [Psychromicrobium silvestre]